LSETVHGMPNYRVDGKVALVTGGGGGIGQSVCYTLAAAGADVVVAELPNRQREAEDTCQGVRASGRRALAVPVDVRDTTSVNKMVELAVAEFGRIDILINSAGINVRKAAFDVTEPDWDIVLDVNLKGLFFVSQAVARQMAKTGGGRIVNMASQLAVVARPDCVAYAASKAGVAMLCKSLAIEWSQHKIAINAVAPTFVDTPMAHEMMHSPDFINMYLPRIPWGRFGTVDDVTGAVLFLASPAADLITGHTMLIDGGFTAQ
jgi:2-dehydro-3-deoxy-D-gluconate 5-dehydrogenase